MFNRSASLAMSTGVLKALPGKLDIKRHSPSILYLSVIRLDLCREYVTRSSDKNTNQFGRKMANNL